MSELPDDPDGSDSAEGKAITGGFLNPPARPHYKDAQGNYVGKPEDSSWGDCMLVSGRVLSARHKKLAELLATTQMTNAELALALNYTEPRVSVLKTNSQILREADRIRDRLFDKNVAEALKDLGPDSVRILEEVITTDNKVSKEKIEVAKWVTEMVGGKAKQQIAHEAGSSILDLLKRLDQLGAGTPAGNETAREVLELSPAEAEEDAITKWARENTGEKK